MNLDPPTASLHYFKETRSDTENPAGSIIQIQVPQNSTFSARPRSHRRILRAITAVDTQEAFSAHYLSKDSSIFRSTSLRYPRDFLWRVINDQKVLELRSVDLSKSDDEPRDALYTVQLCFDGQLKQGGIALTDTDDDNTLNIFALTKANELYTFALRKDIFCTATASEEEPEKWCKRAIPATFSVSAPHRLIAANSVRLYVSLSDGRLLQLTRKRVDDGSWWIEAIYSDGHWGSSLRGLVRWQGSNTVRYDGTTLEQSTPLSMTVSPDDKHVFAVCMNHTLRVWNPTKAGAVFSKDLLWQKREQQDMARVALDPGSPNLLQMCKIPRAYDGEEYYAITYSPHDLGLFKFWGVRDPDHGDRGIRDLFPDDLLYPPDPDPSPESKAIWKVADFKIQHQADDKGLDVWILMRSNHHYQLYNLRSNLSDLPRRWQSQWTATAVHISDDANAPQLATDASKDPKELWLNHIMKPHRYPKFVLETGLFRYCVYRQLFVEDTKVPISDRFASAIAEKVRKGVPDDSDPTAYATASHEEWSILWQDVRDLNASRYHAISLALIDTSNIIFADGCSSIRTCSRLETMADNDAEVLAVSHEHLEMPSVETESGENPKLPDELAVIIESAIAFRNTFSPRLSLKFKSALNNELWNGTHVETAQRLDDFYEHCNFAEEIEDTLFEETNNNLDPIGGLGGLDTQSFLATIDAYKHILPDEPSNRSYTGFGLRTLISGAIEVVSQRETILESMLALAVFVEMDVDREEMPISSFDGVQIFEALIELIKRLQLMQWLASKVQDSSKPPSGMISNEVVQEPYVNWEPTILQTAFAADLKPQAEDTQTPSENLTLNIQDLLQWVVGGNADIAWEQIPTFIQCYLLANKQTDLASDFLRFQPSDPWATYLKGRLCLNKKEPTKAAEYFEEAARPLSQNSETKWHEISSGLLPPLDALHFGHGLPTFYSHLISLFAPVHPTQTAHFATLALRIVPKHPPSEQRTNLLESLFASSLQTTNFPTAYDALTQHPASSDLLQPFITTLLSTPGARPQLLSFPIADNLIPKIDDLLIKSPLAPPKILAAWRLHHNDFRGAAAALLPGLQARQERFIKTASPSTIAREELELENEYLTVINLLSCVGENEGWVLSGGEGKGGGKRKVITVTDLREGYQGMLDRRSIIEGGKWAFGEGYEDGDGMDLLA